METGASDVLGYHGAGDVEAIEIKIKTMDSQTYSLRVDKQMPVPALKERIASVTGVVTEHQRLICRGKVLKDDQLLSAYHVEDGHTLHLVVREPASTSSETLPTDPAAFGRSSNGNHGQFYQAAPGIVVETFNMPGQGDRALPDINRIISAVLGSIGVTNPVNGTEGTHTRDQSSNRASDAPQTQPEQSGVRSQTDRTRLHNAIGIPTAVSFGSIQAPVIPDAVSTLLQYLSQMRQEFVNNGSENYSGISAQPENLHEGLPTPASLAELLSTTRQMLNQQTQDCLLQLARQLENQASMTDPVARASAQSGALRNGSLLQNLGAYFLELGRTVSTLRLGRSPSEAVVNAGPAVFISPSGPNPLMVQVGPSLGTPLSGNFGSGIMNGLGTSFSNPFNGSSTSGSGFTDGLGSAFVPRRIDIQIRRVGQSSNQTEVAGSGLPSDPMDSSTNVSGERPTDQPTSGTSDAPSLSTGSAVRVLPFRTMMAAIPDLNRPPSESPGGSLGMYYPVIGRYPNVASVNLASGSRNHVPSEDQSSRLQTDANSTREQQNVEDRAGNGAPPSSGAGQTEPVVTRTIDINILSAGGIQSDENPDGEVPQGILHLLRGLFPGGEFEVESISNQGGGATGSVAEQERANNNAPVAETQPAATEEGIFMSRLLHQIMPLISQHEDAQLNVGETSQHGNFVDSSTPVEDDSGAGTSRQHDGHNPGPNPKRQKME